MARYADWGEGSVVMADVKSTGMSGICRYISHNPKKNLTRKERDEALALGLDITLVFEDSATRSLQGLDAGRADATFASLFAQQIGARPGMTIRTTVDTDTTWDRVRPYVNGWNIGMASNGYDGDIYAGYPVVAGAVSDGQSKRPWQTVAWSHGAVHPAAVLLQDQFNVLISGVNCDANLVLGQVNGWLAPVTHPTPEDDDMPKVIYVPNDTQRGPRLLTGSTVGAVTTAEGKQAYSNVGYPIQPTDAKTYDFFVAQS
jgi:hypothetical protein